MTHEEIACFKREMRDEINMQVKSSFEEVRLEGKVSFGLIKWVLAILILLFGFFVGSNIYTLITMRNYVTEEELTNSISTLNKQEDKREDYLRAEINRNFSLPVQLSLIQQRQIIAKFIDKNMEKYNLAKIEEEKINTEIFKLNCELKRGGK